MANTYHPHMTATSAQLGWVFSHPGELYSAKRTSLGVRNLCHSHNCANEFRFDTNWNWFD